MAHSCWCGRATRVRVSCPWETACECVSRRHGTTRSPGALRTALSRMHGSVENAVEARHQAASPLSAQLAPDSLALCKKVFPPDSVELCRISNSFIGFKTQLNQFEIASIKNRLNMRESAKSRSLEGPYGSGVGHRQMGYSEPKSPLPT